MGYDLLFPESNPKCFLSDLGTMGYKCTVHYVHISSKLLSLSLNTEYRKGCFLPPLMSLN